MSGGFFDYSQHRFENDFVYPFIEKLKIFEEYRKNGIVDEEEWEQVFANELSEETMNEFRKAALIMKMAVVYAQRIDWFLSGDDGEESFLERLHKELEIASISERNVTDQYIFQDYENKVIKAYDARSEFCRCVYFVCKDNEGYDEWKLIHHIETSEAHLRQHHAERMIEYLKKDFYGNIYYQMYPTEQVESLAKKHNLKLIDKHKMGLDLSWNIGELE